MKKSNSVYGVVGKRYLTARGDQLLSSIQNSTVSEVFFAKNVKYDDSIGVFLFNDGTFIKVGVLGTNVVIEGLTVSAKKLAQQLSPNSVYKAKVKFDGLTKSGVIGLVPIHIIDEMTEVNTSDFHFCFFTEDNKIKEKSVYSEEDYEDFFKNKIIKDNSSLKQVEQLSDQVEGEEKPMRKNNLFSNLVKNVDTSKVKMTMFGLGVENKEGIIQRYNDGVLTDITDFAMDMGMDNMVFAFPAQKDQIKVNDLIVNGNSIVQVLSIDDKITAIDFDTNQEVILIPQKHAMGFSFITKIFAPLGEMNLGSGGMGDVFSNPMFMMMMMGGDGKSSDMMQMMMMSQMMSGFKL